MNDFDKYIAGIYRDMELHLIDSMKRNLARHIAEEGKNGFSYPQWQAQKLKELKRYQRQNKKIIGRYTRGLSKEIAQHMKAELSQGSLSQIKLFKKALKSGYRSAVQMKDSFFKVNDNKVTALITALQRDLGTVNTAILRMMNDTYRETIFRASMFSSNGVLTEKQAYDMAVKDFLDRGINCIVYKDGRRVNIADYASMAVRTASQRAYMVGEGEFRKEIGETLVIVSRHGGACELCAPFENKVLIDDVYSGGTAEDGEYMLLSEAMQLGLYHPRCRHGINTYYPELEEINHYANEDNRLNDYRNSTAHEENMIQRYKRLTTGSIDSENISKHQKRLSYWENQLFTKQSKRDIIKQQNKDIASLQSHLDPKDYFESELGTLPNAFTASTPQAKIQGYLLNNNHPVGQHKEKVLNSVLGYNYNNWDELADYIYKAVQKNGVSNIEVTKYGTKYKVPVRVYGKKKKSMVLNTVWQIDTGSNIPRFITATFKKSTIKEFE